MDNLEIIPQKHSRLSRLLLGGAIKPIPVKREANQTENNPWSKLLWAYIGNLARIGYCRVIQPQDIPTVHRKESMKIRFGSYKKYLAKHTPTSETDYVELWAILYSVKWKLVLCFVTKLASTGCQIGLSILSRNLINEAEKLAENIGYTDHGKAVGFLIGFCILDAIQTIAQLSSWFTNNMLANITKILAMSAIHDKMLRLGPQQRHDYSAAKIVTISGSDCTRASNAFMNLSDLVIFPVNLGSSLGILIYLIGVSSLPGIGLIAVGIIFSGFAAFYVSNLRMISMPFMDKRVSLTRETLKNISILKFYAWERPFAALIKAARKMETRYIRFIEAVDALNISFVIAIPSLAGALSFAVKIIISSNLGPSGAFPALTLFQTFIQAMAEVSFSLTSLADAYVAAKRLNKFFRMPEVPSYIGELPNTGEGDVIFKIVEADFSWCLKNDIDADFTEDEEVSQKKESEEPANVISEVPEDDEFKVILKNVNVTIRAGTMTIVIGKVGSGKTSFLSTFLNAIPKSAGTVSAMPNLTITGVISQWSRSCTIRENILFGLPFDEKKYAETIRVCDLTSDLLTFSNGDKTEIGENGVTLSGGQRARLALARCIYSESELMILDDVLSAMDAKVAGFIFRELLSLTKQKKRTIVMSTNNLKWIPLADTVVTLDGKGGIAQSSNGQTIAGEINRVGDVNNDSPYVASSVENNPKLLTTITSDVPVVGSGFGETTELSMKRSAEAHIQANLWSNSSGHEIENSFSESRKNSGSDLEKSGGIVAVDTTEQEDRSVGAVKNEVLIRYFGLNKVHGFVLACLMLLSLFLYATSESMSNVILNWWTGGKYPKSQGFYIGMYSMDVSLIAVFYAVFSVLFSLLATASSTSLHNAALSGLYGTTMSYFHQNPLGRLMTRFTEDLVNLDTVLMAFGRMLFMTFFPMVASLVVVFVYIPWTILCLIPIFLIATIIFALYLPASREINRCNQLFQSRTMQTLSEHIEGQEVIVSYGQSDASQYRINEYLDDSISANTYNTGIHFWAASRCGLLCEIINLVTLFLAVFNVFSLTPSEVGLMISVLPSIRENLTGLLPIFSLFYNQLNSVERLDQYATRLPVEGSSVEIRTSNWKPSQCNIDFQSVSLRYRNGLPLALKNLNIQIPGGTKVGICGRTGAGKSTIIAALFRFVELSSGKITIDGQNIAEISLEDLRHTFSIIPQAPVLFQGTIKSNIDPFDQFTDAELMSALAKAGISVDSQNHNKFDLAMAVEAEGTNFSLGERQMIALARVLVRNSSVLILDEATASVDVEMEKQIQSAIRTEFDGRTILCIAHRLETIMDYDKIMVMGSGGVLLEVGAPRELYNRNGVFTEMCKEAAVEFS